MSDNMIIHPEYEELMNEVLKLKNDLSLLLTERDELKYHICKNIETEYMLTLGALEYTAYELRCDIMRIKREIELIQAKINRQEVIVLMQIEFILDSEFKEYTDNLNHRMDEINEALKREQSDTLSDDDVIELKKLYRQLVKKLHPDLNPNYTQQQKELFLNTVKAYENGNLEVLRTISMLVEETSDEYKFEDGIEELRIKKNKYKEIITALNNEINTIKSSFPYNQKDFLQNKRLVNERIDELQELIEQYREVYKQYEKKLKEMLGG